MSLEEWQNLPECLRYHGVAPLGDDFLPQRYLQMGEDGKAALIADVQYVLLDIVDLQQTAMGAEPPQPRWQRNQRQRTGPAT